MNRKIFVTGDYFWYWPWGARAFAQEWEIMCEFAGHHYEDRLAAIKEDFEQQYWHSVMDTLYLI